MTTEVKKMHYYPKVTTNAAGDLKKKTCPALCKAAIQEFANNKAGAEFCLWLEQESETDGFLYAPYTTNQVDTQFFYSFDSNLWWAKIRSLRYAQGLDGIRGLTNLYTNSQHSESALMRFNRQLLG